MPINFGIVGLGMIARFHAKAIAATSGAELTAVFSRDKKKARDFSKEFGAAPYTDLDKFLDHANLDAISICTPSGNHLEPCIAAAKAGKHVVCEKPLEINTTRIDKMISACRSSNVLLSGIFPRRFTLKKERKKNQVYLMGPIDSVRAETRRRGHTSIEVEDTAVALCEFQSGAIGVIQGSTASWSKTGHPAEIHITGSRGSVFMADDCFRVWEFVDESEEDQVIRNKFMLQKGLIAAGGADPSAIDYSWHARNYEDIVYALTNEVNPKITGEEARRAVAVVGAIYESAASEGKRVEVL